MRGKRRDLADPTIGWFHWQKWKRTKWLLFPFFSGNTANFDVWPDLSEFSPEELYPSDLYYADGSQAGTLSVSKLLVFCVLSVFYFFYSLFILFFNLFWFSFNFMVGLYTATNPLTIQRHFAWMQTYGLDGMADTLLTYSSFFQFYKNLEIQKKIAINA
jgi:hypothetical protein